MINKYFSSVIFKLTLCIDSRQVVYLSLRDVDDEAATDDSYRSVTITDTDSDTLLFEDNRPRNWLRLSYAG